MARKLIFGMASAAVLLSVPADADWIRDSISPHCSEEARSRVARSVRSQIESSVRRAEAAIDPPAASGDLGCLDGLMDMTLDAFAPTGGLGSLFSGSLDGVIGSGPGARRLCSFAERKWREVTRPITTPLERLKRGLPPNLGNAFGAAESLGPSDAASRENERQPAAASGQGSPVRTQSNSETPPDAGNSGGGSDGSPIVDIWNSIYGEGESR